MERQREVGSGRAPGDGSEVDAWDGINWAEFSQKPGARALSTLLNKEKTSPTLSLALSPASQGPRGAPWSKRPWHGIP